MKLVPVWMFLLSYVLDKMAGWAPVTCLVRAENLRGIADFVFRQ